MIEQPDFLVRFWGVRGSIACPGPETVRYGGNTTCLEIRCGNVPVVIDGGTGMRTLGARLATERLERIDVLLTHTHFDHIAGVPFFRPAYVKDTFVCFSAGHLQPEQTLESVLCGMMIAPLFPVPLNVFRACEYRDFTSGDSFDLGSGIAVRTCPLNHPNRATGYRIDFAGKSICMITDTEHVPGQLDRNIVDLVRGADIMVYDAMYTDDEFPKFVGWGHSTWQEALRIADAAGVRTAVISHHDPDHDDAFMDDVARQAEAMRPGTVVAREGLVLRP